MIGQSIGVLSGAAVFALWCYAMWAPASEMSLSGITLSGAFALSLLAILAIIVSIKGHSLGLFVVFFLSFFPVGFFFLTEDHFLQWGSWLNLCYPIGAAIMYKSRPLKKTDAEE
ncbi:MAG TPA: hypothetical protein DCY55_05875 [Gammaproteobacteria bacterium]|nr:hypothetical protein [Gammaproteobacteria bacterium]